MVFDAWVLIGSAEMRVANAVAGVSVVASFMVSLYVWWKQDYGWYVARPSVLILGLCLVDSWCVAVR